MPGRRSLGGGGWTRLVALASRLRYALVRTRVDEEARREFDTHLELLVDRYVRRGMSRDEARAAARRQFGNALLVREEIYQMNSIGWLEELASDARYGLRLLTRNRGFTVVAGLTLALGIGATSAIFSVLNAVVLTPLPFHEPDRLVWIQLADVEGQPRLLGTGLTDAWRRDSRTLDDVAHALMGQVNMSITGPDGAAERISMEQVDVHTLRVLGIEPALGRWFRPDEPIVEGNSSQSIIISHGLWQRLFGADPNVIGKGLPGWTAGWGGVVAGVMPRGFYTHPSRANTDAWFVITQNPGPAIGRLADGVTVDQARAELDTLTRTLVAGTRQALPDDFRLEVLPLDERYRGEYAETLYMLLAAVGFVLLIAAVNVANLQLNRGATRRAEISIRMALGARRLRLFRQLIVENLILVTIGGALGVLVAIVGIRMFLAVAPDFYPPSEEIGIDATVLLFTAGVCVVTGILSGLAPGLRASSVDLQTALKPAGRTGDGGLRLRLRRTLVVSEIALAMVLLVGAGLMINSYARAMSVDMGIEADNVLSTRVVLLGMDRYRIRKSLNQWIATPRIAEYYTQAIDRLRAVPGVESVAVSSVLPPGNGLVIPFRVVGTSLPDETAAQLHEISPDFFETLRVPVRLGRAFSDADHETAPGVVIVNEAFVRRFLPGGDPLGQSIQADLTAGNPALTPDRVRQVIGVVGDVRPDMRADFEPIMYVPYRQHLTDYPGNFQLAIHAGKDVVIRTSASHAALAPAVRKVFAELDSAVAADTLTTLRARLARSAVVQSFWMRLLGIFAGLGAFLAAIGIYGVVSYTVQQRTQEFGIRAALGAQHGDILTLVLREGAAVTAIGLLLGVGGAFASTRLIQNQLFGISRMDPVTIAAVAAVLLAISLLACFIPARRTTKLNPLTALRSE